MTDIIGTSGNDTINTDPFDTSNLDERIEGLDGDDYIFAGFGRDTLLGGNGSDTLLGAADDDVIDGGPGVDTASYELSPSEVSVNLTISGPQFIGLAPGSDTLLNIEDVFGGAYNDTLTGDGGANLIRGFDGADLINGGGGSDYLRGDAGNDQINGGDDFDDINGNMGADTASGGAGNDWVVGGKDGDLLHGDDGADIVYGNLGDDTCYGDAGNDLIRGGQQNDVLFGGAGDDWLSGDRDNDTLTGGSGADTFHSFSDAGIDRVLDFNRAEGDRVLLDPGSTYTTAQVGGDVVITIGGLGQMTLVGVQLSSLAPGWIST